MNTPDSNETAPPEGPPGSGHDESGTQTPNGMHQGSAYLAHSKRRARRSLLLWCAILTLLLLPTTIISYFSTAYVEFSGADEPWTYVLIKDGSLTFAYLGNNGFNAIPGDADPTDPYRLWRTMYEFERTQQSDSPEDTLGMLQEFLIGETPHSKRRSDGQNQKDRGSSSQKEKLARREARRQARLYGLRSRFAPLFDDAAKKKSTLGFYAMTHSQSATDAILRVPLWAGALPALGAWLFLSFMRNRAASRLRKGLCAICGYSLQGNVSGICPECGEQYALP